MKTIKYDTCCDKQEFKKVIKKNIVSFIDLLNKQMPKRLLNISGGSYYFIPCPMNILYEVVYKDIKGNVRTVFNINKDLMVSFYNANECEREMVATWFNDLPQQITHSRLKKDYFSDIKVFDKKKESVKLNNFLADQGYTITNTKELLEWYLKTIDNTQIITRIND